MKKLLSILALFALTIAPQVFAEDATAKDAMVKPIEATTTLLSYHADWCGGCKLLSPKMKEAMKALDQETKSKLTKVKFDFTDDATKAASKALADEKNLSTLYPEGKPPTGMIKLIDTATGTVLAKINNAMTVEEIIGTLKAVTSRS